MEEKIKEGNFLKTFLLFIHMFISNVFHECGTIFSYKVAV